MQLTFSECTFWDKQIEGSLWDFKQRFKISLSETGQCLNYMPFDNCQKSLAVFSQNLVFWVV